MPTPMPRCSVALACFNVSYQGGNQAANYSEIVEQLMAPTFPMQVPKFFAVYELKDGMPGVYTTKLRITGPTGTPAIEQRLMDVMFTTEIINARVAIEMQGFVFPAPGRYKFELLLADDLAGWFHIDTKQGTVPYQIKLGGS